MIKTKYEELAKIGHKHYNDTNFCSVIAVATICRISFGKARMKLSEMGRQHRRGSITPWINSVIQKRGYNLEFMQSDYAVWKNEFEGHHVKTMPKKLPKGDYLIYVRGHVLAMVDGKINDWSEDRALRVKSVYKVTKN